MRGSSGRKNINATYQQDWTEKTGRGYLQRHFRRLGGYRIEGTFSFAENRIRALYAAFINKPFLNKASPRYT